MKYSQNIEINISEIPDIYCIDEKQKNNKQKIDVYYFFQKDFYSLTDEFFETLSSREKEKAKSFRFKDDSRNYIICHGVLRNLLSRELNQDLSGVDLNYGINEKPYLEGNEIYFNISHTRELCTIALCRNNTIGIDLESAKSNINYVSIYNSYFSENEQQQIEGSKNPIESFYLIWTRKEALLKAMGLGLNTKLKDINLCCQSNFINYNKLCIYQEVNVFSKYYISSVNTKNHFFSIASPDKREIRFHHFKIENLKPVYKLINAMYSLF